MTFNTSFRIQCSEKCADSLSLERVTTREVTAIQGAVYEAGLFLGWRGLHDGNIYCPFHVDALKLTCPRCAVLCKDCYCMGGPRFEARKP